MSTHNYGFLFLIDGIATAISIIIYKYFKMINKKRNMNFNEVLLSSVCSKH